MDQVEGRAESQVSEKPAQVEEELDTSKPSQPVQFSFSQGSSGITFDFSAPAQFSGFAPVDSLSNAYDQYEDDDEEDEDYEDGEDDMVDEQLLEHLIVAFAEKLQAQGITPPEDLPERILQILGAEMPLGFLEAEEEEEDEEEDEEEGVDRRAERFVDNEEDDAFNDDEVEEGDEAEEEEEGEYQYVDENDLVELLVQQLMRSSLGAQLGAKPVDTDGATVEEVSDNE